MEPPEDCSLDLPLMANIDAVRVRHYMFRLRVDDMEERTLHGEAVIFMEHLTDEVGGSTQALKF